MKYYEEFMRASKMGIAIAFGMLIATGIMPWILTENKTEANQQLLGSLYGILISYAGVVMLLFFFEIWRTKRRQKKGLDKEDK